ncbi:iap-2 [Erannis ankeraria nucleopolyhedrovirus]|uniref:iap-2 n=1 Tax=Erannis ankeraria nucleopolyhedrovirus TaxID=2913600 RepID=UPI00117A6BA0|nr:iap-2 [Erannis ankeraria nucleopolyhedrovirus]UJZ89033.1 iap-2 [Erannis ankeraria nucleopolyhedrovirus]
MDYKRMLKYTLPPPHYYRCIENRFETLGKLYLMNDDKKRLAQQGIYFDSNCDKYKCAYCTLTMVKFVERTIKYHAFSTCIKSMQLLCDNESLRKKSFQSFRIARHKYKNTVDYFARNGFYFNGTNAEVKCSDCGIVIVKLIKGDSVEMIHRRYSPHCIFNNIITSFDSPIAKASAPALDDIEEDNNECHQMQTFRGDYNNLYPALTETVENKKIYEESAPNHNQFNNIDSSGGEGATCLICLERQREICFLPCGHVSVCEICSNGCQKCCICREKVKNIMRIFL